MNTNTRPVKHPYFLLSLHKRIQKMKETGKITNIKIYVRSMMITPDCVDLQFDIYNGKQFVKVRVTVVHVGMKFGELCPTRKLPKHTLQRLGMKTK